MAQDRGKDRDLAYTSVATVMKILENKKVLGKNEKEHTYYPLVSRKDYESKTLRHVAQKIFQGNPSSMVARLIDESDNPRRVAIPSETSR